MLVSVCHKVGTARAAELVSQVQLVKKSTLQNFWFAVILKSIISCIASVKLFAVLLIKKELKIR